MSYIAGSSAVTVSTNMSDLYVFTSAEGSSYANQPYAKDLTLSGGADATYTNLTVSAGGNVHAGIGTNVRDVTVCAGGYLRLYQSANVSGLVVESGGWAGNPGNNPTLSNFTIKAGGKLNLGNGTLCGRNNSIAANTLADGALSNTSASVDGVLYGVTQTGGAFNYYDIVFSNFVCGNGFAYLHSGAEFRNASTTAGRGFGLCDSSYLYNAYVSGGYIWGQEAGAAVSLGGAETYISQGAWCHAAADNTGASVRDGSLYATNGVLYSARLRSNGNWLRDLTILEGLTASAAHVSTGGKLNIGSGGIGSGIIVSAGGSVTIRESGTATGITAANNATGAQITLETGGAAANITVNTGAALTLSGADVIYEHLTVNGGNAYVGRRTGVRDVTVSNGGYLRIYSSATVNDLVVESGGWVGNPEANPTLSHFTVKAGGKLNLGNGNIYGRNNSIAANALADGALSNTSASVDGVLYGVTQTGGAFNYYDIVFSNFTCGNGFAYLHSGAEFRNASTTAGRGFGLCDSSYLYNAYVSGGWIWTQEAGAAISLGGAETYIKQGAWCQAAADNTAASVRDGSLYAENGILYSARLRSNGNWLRDLTILEGLTASAAHVSTGGKLTIGSGGVGAGVVLSEGGQLVAKDTGVVRGVTQTGGTISALAGGVVSALANTTLSNVTVSNGGYLRIYSSATVNDLVIESGGWAGNPENNPHLSHFTVKEGGKLNLGNGYISGRNNSVAANGLADGALSNASATVDGMFYGVTQTGGAFNYYDIVFSNFVCGYGFAYLHSGAEFRNASTTAGRGFGLCDSSYLYNAYVSGGWIWTQEAGAAISLGGAETYIKQGAWCQAAADNTAASVRDGSLYAENGILYSARLRSNGNWLRDLTILEGLTASAAHVSTGGKLTIGSGGVGAGVVLSEGGQLVAKDTGIVRGVTQVGGTISALAGGVVSALANTTLSNVTIESAGSLYLATRAHMDGLTVKDGGTANAPDNPYLSNFTVEAGGTLNINNGYLYGRNNSLGANVLTGNLTNTSASVDGVLYGVTQVGGAFNYYDMVVSNFTNNGGFTYLQSGAEFRNASAVKSVAGFGLYNSSYLHNAYVSGGFIWMQEAGAAISLGGAETYIKQSSWCHAAADNITGAVRDGSLYAEDGVLYSARIRSNGNWLRDLTILDGLTASAADVSAGGKLTIGAGGVGAGVIVRESGTLDVKSGTVSDLNASAGARVDFTENKSAAVFTGEKTNIAADTLYYNGTVLGASVVSGVMKNLGADGKTYRIAVGDGITVEDATVNNGCRISAFGGAAITGGLTYGNGGNAVTVLRDSASASGMVLSGPGAGTGQLNLWDDASSLDVVVSKGGVLKLNRRGTVAEGTVVCSGGDLLFNSTTNADPNLVADANGATIENTVIKAGGSLTFGTDITSANTGDRLTLDFTGTTGNQSVYINDLDLIHASTTIMLVGETAGNTYTITTAGATDKYVNCGDWGVYDDRIKAGESVTNAFTGFSYAFNATGTAITVDAVTVGTKTGDASALASDDAITGGRAVKWDSATGVTSGNVFLAGDMTSGQAWVELDGYEGGANTTLYGAQGNSFATGTVNIYAKSGSLRNLAAGANAGGTVKAVNLTVAGAELDGTGYAGGFGNVTGAVKTLVSTGTFVKDFYAGALANKLDSVTSVGNVAMTVDGGTFAGNIYGASAVKTVAGKNGTRHTAGDVTLTVTGGTTTKGAQACIFAGGYATGDATGTVYTVDSVTLDISGGDWGEAAGGRGVFGGIMASGVEAQVLGTVNITISGDATMGNVYGGGWAQKTNGKSIVGDVNINIAGGTITNVFGGGSHSTSGGATETGDVTITVSGGDITGAIYARGQLDHDEVGSAEVIFKGATDFTCDVFGYSYVGGEASDAALSFSGYTGEFSGSIGGFNGITLDKATAMTLVTAADDVSNTKWEFDLTDRADTLAGTSLLTWSNASFTNGSIKVSFADDTQAQSGWNIATVTETFSGTTFDVKVGDSEIAAGLAYNQQIASGDYAGWGFDLESGVLKFKNLASA